ncbi:hypothetical protein [Streptomyces sp. NPDC047097]|uniref:hypothetical protein n=1 Tax=Streptomyces sp. NPDC047097 TaxID=3155260 RepID=UPI0033F8B81E
MRERTEGRGRRAEQEPPHGAENTGPVTPLVGELVGRSAEPQRPEPRDEERGGPAHTSSTVLRADRGIINTGTVFGGQHVTGVEVAGDYVHGAGDVV